LGHRAAEEGHRSPAPFAGLKAPETRVKKLRPPNGSKAGPSACGRWIPPFPKGVNRVTAISAQRASRPTRAG
jgi:hypothetical protein